MSITKTLKSIIADDKKPSIGTVIDISAAYITVNTATGIEQVPIASGVKYNKGDQARIVNGVAVGKIKPQKELPVYYV